MYKSIAVQHKKRKHKCLCGFNVFACFRLEQMLNKNDEVFLKFCEKHIQELVTDNILFYWEKYKKILQILNVERHLRLTNTKNLAHLLFKCKKVERTDIQLFHV